MFSRCFDSIVITQSSNKSGILRLKGKNKVQLRTKLGGPVFIMMLELVFLSSQLLSLRTAKYVFLITQHSGFSSFLTLSFFPSQIFNREKMPYLLLGGGNKSVGISSGK